MSDDELLDLYSDYLISAFGAVTGTGLAAVLEGQISHDRVQRFLSREGRGSAELWRLVKKHVRAMQQEDGVLIIDDSIAAKPYTDENEIVCWHYDHTSGQSIKGINFISVLYQAGELSLPVGFELVAKTESYVEAKTGKTKRRSPISKNQYYRDLVQRAVQNRIPFKYVLNDVWFASAENMRWIKGDLQRDFIMPIKTNRTVALSTDARSDRHYQRVDTLDLEAHTPTVVYLEDVPFPLLLVKQSFTDEAGTTRTGYLITSDLTLSNDDFTTLYHKRWQVERYHQSLKQNAALEKSPTRTPVTQRNHLFAALCAYVKLELLRKPTQSNHFALKTQLYTRAVQFALAQLRLLEPVRLAA